MKISKIAILVAAVGMSSAAFAADEYAIDVNDVMAITSGGLFSTSYTGTVTVAGDSNSVLASVRLDGDDAALTSTLNALSVTFNLSGGAVTGGSVSLSAMDGSLYTSTLIAGGGGGVKFQAGQGFSIDALVSSPTFNGPTFAGADVSSFLVPHDGAVLLFSFDPGVGTSDSISDFEIYGQIPSPGALGLLGLGGLVATRRRR
ncbi:MAG: hypothetical protein JNM07_11590 [Phycisphaerae bacterium]|nr:hypothetical protein [Phycisphaerae bacterium]